MLQAGMRISWVLSLPRPRVIAPCSLTTMFAVLTIWMGDIHTDCEHRFAQGITITAVKNQNYMRGSQ